MRDVNRKKLTHRPREARMRVGIIAWVFMACIAGIAIAQPKVNNAPAPAAAPPAAAPAAAPAADPAAPAVGDDGAPVTPLGKESAFELFRKGGIVMWMLLGASIIAVTIIIERFVALRKSTVVPSDFLDGLRAVYRDRDRDRPAALNYCQANDSSLSRMVAAGIRKVARGHAAVEKAIEDAGANEALKLRKNLRVLYAIGS